MKLFAPFLSVLGFYLSQSSLRFAITVLRYALCAKLFSPFTLHASLFTVFVLLSAPCSLRLAINALPNAPFALL